jgi:hypothetical protein
MFNEVSERESVIVPVEAPPAPPSATHEKAAAVKAIEALREHGNIGVARNLEAGASLAALKVILPHGEFGPFCEQNLAISSSYRARLLKLNDVREHVSGAQVWAATQKHRLAECQSAQNLIRLVNDWFKRDEPQKPKAIKTRLGPRSGLDGAAASEWAVQKVADHIVEEGTITFELKSELANRDDVISNLQRVVAECEEDFIALRDSLPDEAREKALVALASSREHEFAAIAKRFHWRTSDLRRELEN